MTNTKPKPVEEQDLASRLQSISEQLEEAEKAVAVAQEAHESVTGLEMLGEVDDKEVRIAEDALAEGNRHLAALKSARRVLEARGAAQTAQDAQQQVMRWREESKKAAGLQTSALARVADLTDDLRAALEVVHGQGTILDALHHHLADSDPERAGEVDQDFRDALARLADRFAQKRIGIKEAAASAQYRVQRPSDGTDPVLRDALTTIQGDRVADAGATYSEARQAVLGWEFDQLQEVDEEHRSAQRDAFEEHASRTVVAGLGYLSTTISDVRDAAALDHGALRLLLPDETARALAGLSTFMPASATEAIAIRSAPRTALEARQGEARLQAGRRALQELVH